MLGPQLATTGILSATTKHCDCALALDSGIGYLQRYCALCVFETFLWVGATIPVNKVWPEIWNSHKKLQVNVELQTLKGMFFETCLWVGDEIPANKVWPQIWKSQERRYKQTLTSRPSGGCFFYFFCGLGRKSLPTKCGPTSGFHRKLLQVNVELQTLKGMCFETFLWVGAEIPANKVWPNIWNSPKYATSKRWAPDPRGDVFRNLSVGWGRNPCQQSVAPNLDFTEKRYK